MIRTSVCAGPWDFVGDAGAAERFAAFGADSVSVAAAYHSVRAATPRHQMRRFMESPHSALYLPTRPEKWQGVRLQPSSALSWMGVDDAFGQAQAALTEVGVRTVGWVVLTHNDAPAGPLDNELNVKTAFGDALSYALCPSSDDVLEYCATLVSAVAETGIDEIMLEAVGQVGFDHGGAHDKTSGADWSALDRALLSVCCCVSCAAALREVGIDMNDVAAAIRSAVGRGLESMEEALGEYAKPVLAARLTSTSRLHAAVVEAARAGGVHRLTSHVGLSPWAASSFSPMPPGAVDLDAIVLSDSTVATLDASAIAALKSERQTGIAAYVSVLPPVSPKDLLERWEGFIRNGVDEMVVYHGGLVSENRASAVTDALKHIALL